MKMLTIHNLGAPEPDFCWGVEGELAITMMAPCDRKGCGCDRAHTGLNSHQGSTTVMVRDVDLNFGDMVKACLGFLTDAGWTKYMDNPTLAAADIITFSASIAEGFPVGTVLRSQFDHTTEEWVYTEGVGETR